VQQQHRQRRDRKPRKELIYVPRPDYLGMELVFLGTASGSPTTERSGCSLAVRCGTLTWLFDCGEGTQRQLLCSTVSEAHVSRIFISHVQPDHIAGLTAVLLQLSELRSGQVRDGNLAVSCLHVQYSTVHTCNCV
jgi:ribonuclease BN (tRNA processing enzyme)